MRVPSVSLYISAHFIVLVDLTWGLVVSGRTWLSGIQVNVSRREKVSV